MKKGVLIQMGRRKNYETELFLTGQNIARCMANPKEHICVFTGNEESANRLSNLVEFAAERIPLVLRRDGNVFTFPNGARITIRVPQSV